MVSERGIEIHPAKSKAILDMVPPKNLKKLQTLTGRLAALNRFIAKSGEAYLPFFKAMRKSAKFEWTEECAAAFDKLKEYLTRPPCLSRPLRGETLILYLAATSHAISAALVREEEGTQRPVYFVSHVLRDAETRYPSLEKMAYALIMATRKLKPYFQAHPVKVVTGLPLKKVLTDFNSSGRLLGWALELTQYALTYHPPVAQKSQIFADFLADYSKPQEPVSSKWTLSVDGASSRHGSGAGVALTGPRGEIFNYALHFLFPVTNNVAEYKAMIAGLKLAKELGAREVCLYSDSQLAVRQLNGDNRVIDANLTRYWDYLKELTKHFEKIDIQHIPRNQNCQADALSKLGAAGNLDKERPVIVMNIPNPSIMTAATEVLPITESPEAWYAPMWNFLTNDTLPIDKLEARRIKRLAPMYSILNNCLYKRGYTRPWLKCVTHEKARELLAEAHEGICGSHQGAKTLAHRILRAGFYWPTMKGDATNLVRKCEKCQFNSKLSHIPPYERITISGAWPFDLWGIDIVGPFLLATQQRRWIVVAVEYFTKWVEAEALASITSAAIESFVWKNIICRFGIPHALISDNGTQFASRKTVDFLSGLGIKNNFSSVSHPSSNGLAEVTNRTILEGLKRKAEENRKNWPDLLDEILWAYRTTPREATRQSPYSLVYGMEAVTPLELVEPSLRMTLYDEVANRDTRALELEFIDETRGGARIRVMEYQRRIKKAFDKHVTTRCFQPGDLVLRKVSATGKPKGKLDPAWEGPYRVLCSYGIGAYKLERMQGGEVPRAWNAGHLRKFYT